MSKTLPRDENGEIDWLKPLDEMLVSRADDIPIGANPYHHSDRCGTWLNNDIHIMMDIFRKDLHVLTIRDTRTGKGINVHLTVAGSISIPKGTTLSTVE